MKKQYLSDISNMSTSFFYTPPNHLPDFFYYPLCIGHFFCNISYKVVRNQYDSFLFLYTKSGNGMVSVGDEQKEQNPGDLCLIDCYLPHSYWATGEWEILWIHVDGGASRSYFDYLADGHYFQILLKDLPFTKSAGAASAAQIQPPSLGTDSAQSLKQTYAQLFEQTWSKLHEAFLKQETLDSPILSLNIQELFTILALAKEERHDLSAADFIDDTLKYIRRHLVEPLTLKQLAARVSLSQFYFSRKFKEKTGYTPYDYILTSRLNLARYYLKSSQETVKSIGYSCGFQSEHSFCTAFKNETGMTPTEFRQSSNNI